MAKKRIPWWIALPILGIGAVVAFVVGIFVWRSLTAPTLHPDIAKVPTSAHSSVAASKNWADALKQGHEIARASLVEQNLPGLSVAVGVGGEIVWAEGFGFANLEHQTPVSPDTRFRTGEVAKAFTSAAVGRLLEKKALTLDEEIQTYVPDYPKKQWPVTLRQLMAHTAGLATDGGDEAPIGTRCERTAEGLQHFADDSLLFEPGTKYHPSSWSWVLVSAAVESATPGQSFFTVMRTQVFDPLGMTATVPDSVAEQIPNRTTFYFPKFAGDNRYGPQDAREGDHSCWAGGGAFLSTPSDLVRFGMAFNSGKVVQPATVQLLQTPQKLSSGAETGYGLGWKIETLSLRGEQARMAGHGTSEDFIGTTAYLMAFPDRGMVVAVMSNTSFADAKGVALKIAEVFASHMRR
jgi:CubicO group peptidase (beta-lactamase class C family)